eukprot:jgi/Chrpa1/27388/Chrysochromulina_OHIO_Genome00002500-RA
MPSAVEGGGLKECDGGHGGGGHKGGHAAFEGAQRLHTEGGSSRGGAELVDQHERGGHIGRRGGQGGRRGGHIGRRGGQGGRRGGHIEVLERSTQGPAGKRNGLIRSTAAVRGQPTK